MLITKVVLQPLLMPGNDKSTAPGLDLKRNQLIQVLLTAKRNWF